MYDGITQQYYLRARFYNPVIGRFTQEDTYYGDGLNLYEYGRNNPVRYIDPSGHEVRAAEKNYVNRAVDAMNRTADQGVNGMLERVYGDRSGLKPNLTPSQIDDVVNTPKGNRPDPSTYLSQKYIETHLSRFDDGAAYILPESDYDLYYRGVPEIARDDGTLYVTSQNYLNQVLKEADGDLAYVEKALGYPNGTLSNGEFKIININKPSDFELSMPNGNEAGANSKWIPGGYTSGGVPEAIVHNVPNESSAINIETISLRRK